MRTLQSAYRPRTTTTGTTAKTSRLIRPIRSFEALTDQEATTLLSLLPFMPVPDLSSPSQPFRRPAWTLLELVLVIAILALLATLVLPHWSQADSTAAKLRSGADLVIADLSLAQSHSLANSEDPCAFVPAPDSRGYWIAAQSQLDQPLILPSTQKPLCQVVFGQGPAAALDGLRIQILDSTSQPTSQPIRFGSFGQLAAGSPNQVRLQIENQSLTIRLSPDTGRATIISP